MGTAIPDSKRTTLYILRLRTYNETRKASKTLSIGDAASARARADRSNGASHWGQLPNGTEPIQYTYTITELPSHSLPQQARGQELKRRD